MKFIHTGDWHIGKIVNEFSMLEDQRFVLNQLINIIEEERPNALVIAGDLYDRSIPPVEAVELLDDIFSRILLELNVPILAIAGNHDSAERLSFASNILTKHGLHIAGTFSSEIKRVVLEDEFGPVNFYLVPYADPKEVRHIYKDEEISSHDIAMRKVVERLKQNMKADEKHVMVAHGYITFMADPEEGRDENIIIDGERSGLKICDSERPLSIGGSDLISGKYFDCFNYTALGHLHSRQKVGSERMRYSGSLLKYSLSEANHIKGVTIVNLDRNGEVTTAFKALNSRRDIRIIKGPLNELISPSVYSCDNVEDYVYAVLTDEGELVDPISKLRAVYPNIMGLRRETLTEKELSRTSAAAGHNTKSKLELFEEFYGAIVGRQLSEDRLDIISEVIEAVEKEAM
ncbi:MAG: exonuclease SbcCD subunit D [Bacillota bacterium]|nr:exonuclease SbcCD subunit D [Bacillota bacterium]